MSHEKLSELCSIYALGALDGDELRELEIHLKSGCPLCEQQIREFADVIANVPQALPGVAPSPELRTRLMLQLDKYPQSGEPLETPSSTSVLDQPKPTKSRSWLPWACTLAAGIGLVVSLWNLSRLREDISNQQLRLHQQIDQIKQLQNQLDLERTVTAFLGNPEVRVTALAGTPKSPQSSGKSLWDPKEKRALFYAAHLPVAPSGKTYQLWIIAQNKPFDAGTFSVDQNGNGFLKIDLLSEADKAQKFAVTLEPAGGVPQPTGEMHLLGSL
jgi:anti-sigma-K factor RskA